jgi:subtilisin family serine protease
LCLFASFLMLLGALVTPAAAEPAATTDKIEPAVLAALDSKDSTDFWVMFADRADLSSASRITDWTDRGEAVVAALRATADRSQADVKTQLGAADVGYQSFWIANAIHVSGGTAELAESLAKRADVATIRAPQTYSLPKPIASSAESSVDAVEWGIAAIRANEAWSTFGATGDGIVVANIDSGVQFDHPALVGKYRGNTGGGFDHNYNWYDPSNVCGNPSAAPCDNNGHGTHTMGTMVGGEGANQIGVAPGARWIAAKGCESSGCSETALLASGQWVLAPTDLTGQNPRADLRPNIVNNSWGASNGGTIDPWYRATVQAWVASGIFPAFSNGNSGPSCNTAGSPGDNVESYASGAYDVNGAIASFSSRGPGENGDVKPNLSAPGVNVRSSVPGNGYGANSGTSMASPHTAGTVALMWSAAPSLVGDIGQTETLLDESAVDVNDTTCGGTAADNNVWGEGKLDAFGAVDRSPRGPVGTLTGTVTNEANGTPLAGVSVRVAGPSNRTTVTGADGTYTSTLPVGDYTLTAGAFGYAEGSATATVTEGQSSTANIALAPVASHPVSGRVLDQDGGAVANATVRVAGTPIAPVTSGADGSYSIQDVPEGSYTLTATAGGCSDPQSLTLVVDGAETLDFGLPYRGDSFGYHCVLEPGNYVEADTPVALTGDDAATALTMPFDFYYYGRTYREAHLSTNGHVNFLANVTAYSNGTIPAAATPNAAIYPFWDDLRLDAESQVLTKVLGAAPDREFVIEWRNAAIYNVTGARIDFEVVLSENGEVSLRYRNLDAANPRETGSSATVGIENHAGTVALQYSQNTPALSDQQSIRFTVPPNGLVSGTVTDVNDGLAVAGATVTAKQGDTDVASTTVGADGAYRLRLLAGDYTVVATKANYVTATAATTIANDATVARDLTLATPMAVVEAAPLSFLAQPGQLRSATITLSNPSALGLDYQLADGASWLWTVPGSGNLAGGKTVTLTVRVDAAGLAAGVYESAVTLTSNAGRNPSITVPVKFVVPAHRTGVDVGGGTVTDSAGDAWVSDQAWTAGGYGYVKSGRVVTSRHAIDATSDDRLFQTQREGTGGYRFDNLPAGTYQVELGFAELVSGLRSGMRVFDVSVNGTRVLPGYDIAARVGTYEADTQVFTVTVADGGSVTVDLASRKGKLPPVLNTVRITHRPDLG